MIVLLEEDFYDKKEYGNVKLSDYERKSKIRFSISNSNKKDLDTPTKIHPKNPCLFYESLESNKHKRQYKDALKEILETPFQFFEKEEAIKTLSNTFEDLQIYRNYAITICKEEINKKKYKRSFFIVLKNANNVNILQREINNLFLSKK